MDHDATNRAPHLSEHLARAHANLAPWRTTSLRLLMATLVFVILATGIAHRITTPHTFFWFLALNLLFLFAVMVLAIRDFRKLFRRYMVDREAIYNDTLGDDRFIARVRDGLKEKRGAALNDDAPLPPLSRER